MKIGITSQNFRTITGHAGKTRRFLILAANEQGVLSEVERLDLSKEMSLHEFRGMDHPLFALDVLITGGHGQGFAKRLSSHGVTVIATSENDPMRAASAYVAGSPLPPPAPHEHHHPAPSAKLKTGH